MVRHIVSWNFKPELTPEERRAACRRAEETFRDAGAHFVLNNLSQLPELLHMLG